MDKKRMAEIIAAAADWFRATHGVDPLAKRKRKNRARMKGRG